MAGTATWRAIVVEDLYSNLIDEQIKALLRQQEGDPTDPLNVDAFASNMPRVAAVVRTAIASNPQNHLSATPNSVPPELLDVTVTLTMEALQSRFSVAQALTPYQLDLVKEAKRILEQVRNWADAGRQFIISLPDDPEDSPSQYYKPTMAMVGVSACSQRLSREELIGL